MVNLVRILKEWGQFEVSSLHLHLVVRSRGLIPLNTGIPEFVLSHF